MYVEQAYAQAYKRSQAHIGDLHPMNNLSGKPSGSSLGILVLVRHCSSSFVIARDRS